MSVPDDDEVEDITEEMRRRTDLSADFLSLETFVQPLSLLSHCSRHTHSPKRSPKRKEPRKPAGLPPWATSSYSGKWAYVYLRQVLTSCRLHDEILDFCNYMAPTPVEEHMRQALIAKAESVVKGLWPDAELLVFGSCSTGIYLPTR